MWNHMWGWDGQWGMAGGWGWFGLVHLLWWVLLVAGVAYLLRSIVRGERGGDRALEILRERYARGEIDQAEYSERVRQLKAS